MSTNNAKFQTPEDTMSEPKLPECDDVEITPEMIEAGVDRLLEYSVNFDDPSEVVRRVLASCLSAPSAHAVQKNT